MFRARERLGVFLFAGVIGMMDDAGKTRKKENKAGLSERAKLTLQLVVAGGFLVVDNQKS